MNADSLGSPSALISLAFTSSALSGLFVTVSEKVVYDLSEVTEFATDDLTACTVVKHTSNSVNAITHKGRLLVPPTTMGNHKTQIPLIINQSPILVIIPTHHLKFRQ